MKIKSHKKHIFFLCALIVPFLWLSIMSADQIISVHAGQYTETWTISTSSTAEETSSTQETSKSGDGVQVQVTGEKVIISVFISGVSIFVAKTLTTLQKPREPDESAREHVPETPLTFASDLNYDVIPEQYRKAIKTIVDISELKPEEIQKAIDSIRKGGGSLRDKDLKTQIDLRARLMQDKDLAKDPYLETALAKLCSEKWKPDDITPDEVKEAIEDLKQLHEELKNAQWCPTCDRAVPKNERLFFKQEHARTKDKGFVNHCDSDGNTKHYRWMRRKEDVYTKPGSAWNHQLRKWGLPHPSTHVQCSKCRWYTPRDKIEQTFVQKWLTANYNCPQCDHEQSIPAKGGYAGDFGSMGGR